MELNPNRTKTKRRFTVKSNHLKRILCIYRSESQANILLHDIYCIYLGTHTHGTIFYIQKICYEWIMIVKRMGMWSQTTAAHFLCVCVFSRCLHSFARVHTHIFIPTAHIFAAENIYLINFHFTVFTYEHLFIHISC